MPAWIGPVLRLVLHVAHSLLCACGVMQRVPTEKEKPPVN